MKALVEELINLAIQIQQIPAPTFVENERAQFVLEKFRQENLTDLQIDSVGNVFARLKGTGAGAPLVVSAHLDTVFPAETNLAVRRLDGRVFGPGVGDNSLGVAGLFGLLWMLHKNNTKLPCDLWLIANVGEEGLGDLKGMRAVVERFKDLPRAYLVIEGAALGHVYHAGIGVHRYKITAYTEGGHAWVDYGKPSAIHELSGLINHITAIPLTLQPRTTLNVGRVGGGTSINTIAPSAWFELDVRSEDNQVLKELIELIKSKVAQYHIPGLSFEIEKIGERPSGRMSTEHPIIVLASQCLVEQGLQPQLTSGSTDANIPLSLGYPALVLGLTQGGRAHTLEEYIETEWLERGLQQLFRFVERVSGLG